MTVAVPLLPSLLAVITADPAAIAVTTPEIDTLATDVLLDVHVTTRPVSTAPFASRVVAVSAEETPGCVLTDPGATLTVATGTTGTVTLCTVIAAVADLPSAVAVIVALPAATACTCPSANTVATAGLDVVHTTVRPVSKTPAASRTVATS